MRSNTCRGKRLASGRGIREPWGSFISRLLEQGKYRTLRELLEVYTQRRFISSRNALNGI
jgi:hypothetical protein